MKQFFQYLSCNQRTLYWVVPETKINDWLVVAFRSLTIYFHAYVDVMNCLLRASNWGDSHRHCHSRCGTIKDPFCLKAVSAEHRARFKSPSSADCVILLCVNYSRNFKQRTVDRLYLYVQWREIRFGFSLRIVTLSFTPSAKRLTMELWC